MADDQNEILDNYDVEEGEELTPDEQDRRVAEFLAQVEKRTAMIMKPKQNKPEDRIKAIRWLGESGEGSAIESLVKVYQKDKTPGVKEAAAYALGQLKTLGVLLEDPETQESATQNVMNIILYKQMGKRVDKGKLRLAQIILLVSAVVLFAVGGFLNMTLGPARAEAQAVAATQTQIARPTDTPDVPEIIAPQMQEFYTALVLDASVLQGQLARVTREGGQDCSVTFNNPPAFVLSPVAQADATLNDIGTRLNTVRDNMLTVLNPFIEACNQNIPINRQDALGYGSTIIEAQRQLNEIIGLFANVGVELPTPEIVTPTSPPTDTPEPSATPDIADARTHIATLELIINQVTEPRGAASLLVVYWGNLRDFGSSEGCRQPDPVLPEDYILPELIGQRFPEVAAARDNVNLGLLLTRQNAAGFRAACNSSEPTAQVNERLQQITAAVTAFEDARNLLDGLQGR